MRRIEARLPFEGFPQASAVVERGCASFAMDDAFRRRLAGVMLGDMVGRATFRQLRASLAA